MSEEKIAPELRRSLKGKSRFVGVSIIANDNGFDRLVDSLEQSGVNYTPLELQRSVLARLPVRDIRYWASKTYVAQISSAGE